VREAAAEFDDADALSGAVELGKVIAFAKAVAGTRCDAVWCETVGALTWGRVSRPKTP